ncbi:MAG TPA: helix-turn-helix transcriptional regulator [Thermoanaerobaculia bacterium]
MIGERLREARQAQNLSLVQVASKAKMSAATLSRIENEKQALDVGTLFVLARIVDVAPENLVAAGNGGTTKADRELVDEIASLTPQERARLWRTIALTRRKKAARNESDISAQFDELLAQLDLLRYELESLRARQKRR